MTIDARIARPAGFAAAIVAAVLLLAMLGGAVAPPDADAAKRKRAQRSVLFVGNNWDGTADVVEPARRRSAASPSSTSFPTSRSGCSRSTPTRCGSATSSRSAS